MIKTDFKNFKLIILLTIVSIAFSSCFDSVDETTQILDFQNDLGLELLQNLESKNDFYWLVSTNESNFCKESRLVTEYIKDQNVDILIINGLETPNNCSSYSSRITSVEGMEMESDKKDIVINIANKLTYSTTLSKEDNMIAISSESSNAFDLRESYLQIIDDNHMWGGLHNITDQNKALFFNLYSNITELLVYEQVEQGNHGYFSYKNSTLRILDPTTFDETEVGFAIKLQSDFVLDEEKLRDVVLDFRMSHPEIDFFINLGNGRQF